MRDAAVMLMSHNRPALLTDLIGQLAASFEFRQFDLFVWDNGSSGPPILDILNLHARYVDHPMMASWVFDRAASWDAGRWNQNISIQRFIATLGTIQANHPFCVLMENDSILPPTWLGGAIEVLTSPEAEKERIKVVGPAYQNVGIHDHSKNPPPLSPAPIQIGKYRVQASYKPISNYWAMRRDTLEFLGAPPGMYPGDQWYTGARMRPMNFKYGHILDGGVGLGNDKVKSSRVGVTVSPYEFFKHWGRFWTDG